MAPAICLTRSESKHSFLMLTQMTKVGLSVGVVTNIHKLVSVELTAVNSCAVRPSSSRPPAPDYPRVILVSGTQISSGCMAVGPRDPL